MQSPPRVAGNSHWTAVAAENFSEPLRGRWQLPLSPEQQLREAVLLFFCDPLPMEHARLKSLSLREWKRLLHWLDISGVALYFLDRIMELELCELLPAMVLS